MDKGANKSCMFLPKNVSIDQCLFFYPFSVDQSGKAYLGPVKNRSGYCTDIFGVVAFLVFLVGWAIIGFYGKENENPIDVEHILKLPPNMSKSCHVIRGLLFT
jgi:hypothetical protein